MAEKERGRGRRAETTPEDFPTASSQSLPSGDYSYTLEICMNLRESMGKVVEAIETLKHTTGKQSDKLDKQDDKLSAIAKDIHAAKVAGALLAIVAGVLGFFGKIVFDYLTQ